MRTKLLLIDFGGSLGMRYNQKKHSLEPSDTISHLFRHIPELQSRFDLDIEEVYQGNSYDIHSSDWLTLADVIHKNYHDYEGFVVLHGTSTMTYTASFLSFVFQNLDKPIVFTGSILPLEEFGSEARNNIINACLVASFDYAEVLLVYGSKILRANRSKKKEESYANVFHSPNFPALGEIKRPFVMHDLRKKRRKRILKYQPTFSDDVLALRITPGFTGETLLHIAKGQHKAVVLEAYGAGLIPTELMPAIKELIKSNIPVVLASQMYEGIATPFTYNYNADLHQTSLIFGFDMTIETIVTKLMWVMGQTKVPLLVKQKMYENMAEEISEDLVTMPVMRKY